MKTAFVYFSTGYASRAHRVSNQQFDEAVEVGDDDNDYMRDSLDSNNSDIHKKRGDTPPILNEDNNDTDDEHDDMLMRQGIFSITFLFLYHYFLFYCVMKRMNHSFLIVYRIQI